MRIWRVIYEVIFVLILIILGDKIIDVPYGEFIAGIFGIIGMEIFGYCCENKKI